MKEKILLVDDEMSIVTLLSFHIEKAGYDVGKAYDGLTALEMAETGEYDLIVLDLMLPKLGGLEVCKILRDNGNNIPILMLTAKGEEDDKVKGLDLGADDYLTKPFSPKEAVARIKAVLRRVGKNDESVASVMTIGDITIFPKKYEATKGDNLIRFTRKEFELLLYLAKHRGTILSRERLLLAVWNYDFVGDSRIVDVHVSRLREKLESDSKKPQYIKTVRGLGYKLEDN
ncbi:response regulator transcription factor [Virgibacillus sp. 179-BFC.A HS]|uniref:Response regulator transcription factor n=1 Tax=Tigheibacillus jepli TaxID=3035914 RepID=A0ABU5CHR8_9BACI|nr:response regulator transcription factor [Virgibacillus sp. 179-BFC.A HS]MDY0405359.1 response regulator transcription factor [Virgibacillus sp. 179-BFC.A HS]